jgi:hypothetical protein
MPTVTRTSSPRASDGFRTEIWFGRDMTPEEQAFLEESGFAG